MQDDLELRSAIEAAFGPGAFEMIAEMESADPCSGEEPTDLDEDSDVAPDTTAPAALPARAAANDLLAGRPPVPCPQTLLLFELAGAQFGISIANVVEVQQVPPITRITRGPEWLRGLANLRGTIIPVVDLRVLLGQMPAEGRNPARMIVVRTLADASTTGLIVDGVLGLRGQVAGTEESPVPAHGQLDCFVSEYIECDGQLVAVLELEGLPLFSDTRQFQSA